VLRRIVLRRIALQRIALQRIAQLQRDPAPLLPSPRTDRRTTRLGAKPSVQLQHHVPKCLVHPLQQRGKMLLAPRMRLVRRERCHVPRARLREKMLLAPRMRLVRKERCLVPRAQRKGKMLLGRRMRLDPRISLVSRERLALRPPLVRKEKRAQNAHPTRGEKRLPRTRRILRTKSSLLLRHLEGRPTKQRIDVKAPRSRCYEALSFLCEEASHRDLKLRYSSDGG
jgi:hypothetical protein